ncbi:hypothetical protein SSABA_v1c06720 [Spiroplasma sabaudiense Ar-1343]|uniref:Uncharacterized protein n=1 Tax=Spiroplasma sabaudiense Ar-1343 TaxID=1276257 RepID=W6AK20_9MOLU|nr:hypothetical protein [Spiroplasma sabaudiense]AHI54074.1 hypothetical protein SSABA_v1c06720 [Spiroplasma sabaudiense Ar-1343]
MRKKTGAKNLSKTIFDDFFWITNFYPVGSDLYITDSDFENNQNYLLKIDQTILTQEVKIKSPWNRYFLAHPDPSKSSAIGSSQTDLKICLVDKSFIQNIIGLEDNFLVTFVRKQEGNFSTTTSIYNSGFEKITEIPELQNFTIISPILNSNCFVIRKNDDGQTAIFNYDEKKQIPLNGEFENCLKVIMVGDDLVVLATNYHVFKCNIDFKNRVPIVESNFEKQISQFNETGFLVSDRVNGQTSFHSINETIKNSKLIINKYFYKIDAINKNLIIGKPLIDEIGAINYHLPVWFIY